MAPRPSLLCTAAAVCLAAAGCAGEPPTSSGDATDTASTASTASTGSTGSETGADPSEPTGGAPSREPCERYLECVGAVTPDALPAALAGFGDTSVCWQGGPDDAQACLDSCRSLLAQFHDMFPAEPACDECRTDADCDADAGEFCFEGGCGNSACGNGIVEPEEVCDGQPKCGETCQGPAGCSPLTGFPCDAVSRCTFVIDLKDPELRYHAGCADVSEYELKAVGEDCSDDLTYKCEPGGYCTRADMLASGCGGQYCCAAFCDRTQPGSCPDGSVCTDYREVLADVGTFQDEGLDYLGVCAAP